MGEMEKSIYEQIYKIAKGYLNNIVSVYLFLLEGEILDKAVEALAQALASEHCKLTSIELRDSMIGDKGLEALFSVIDHFIDNNTPIKNVCHEKVTEYIDLINNDNIVNALENPVIYKHLISNIEKYNHIKALVINNIDLVTNFTARHHTYNTETVKYLCNLKDVNGISLLDINKEIEGSTIITYYRNDLGMVRFLMNHGAKYPLDRETTASLEAKIIRDNQSAHGNQVIDQYCYKLLTKLYTNFKYNGEEIGWILSLITELKNAYNSTSDINIDVPGVKLSITVNTKARQSLKITKNNLLQAKLPDYKNKQDKIAPLQNVIENEFFDKAIEGLKTASQHSCCILGKEFAFKEVISLIYNAIIAIANETQDLSGLNSNILDFVCEVVDFATTYDINSASCSSGTVKKVLSTIDNKHPLLVINNDVIVNKQLSLDVNDTSVDQLINYTVQAWNILSPQVKESYLILLEDKAVDCFRGAIYQILYDAFGDVIGVEDIAKIQSLILQKNSGSYSLKEDMPKYILDIISLEYEKELGLKKKLDLEQKTDQIENHIDHLIVSNSNNDDMIVLGADYEHQSTE